MATKNAEMTNLIANYIVNYKGFYGLGPKGEGTPQAHKNQFKPISNRFSTFLRNLSATWFFETFII